MDKTFRINDQIVIECEWKKARDGFNHKAYLVINGCTMDTAKVHWVNRTWEAYEYQEVIHKLVDKTKVLTQPAKERVLKAMDGEDGRSGLGRQRDMEGLGFIGKIAMLGDIFCDKQEDKNDWKKRMLKAGLGDNMMIPEDWDQLSEEEKQKRLDGAINVLTEEPK